jgi:anti-anti-sigma regulatory factor
VLRITRVNPGETPVLLKLEGHLRGPWVPELRRVAALSTADGSPVVLDLEGVSLVDAAGVALLRTLVAQRAELCGASTFVASLVKGESDECA